MPGDDIESLSMFEAEESDHDDDNHFVHKEELTKDYEKAADKDIDELELNSLTSKVKQLESSLVQRVVDKIEDFVPKMVVDALKDQLPELLSDTFKTILPDLLKDFVKTVLTAEVPKIILKPLNKEFHALNTLENNRIDDLQKNLTNAIKIRSSKSSRGRVKKAIKGVGGLLKYYITLLDKGGCEFKRTAPPTAEQAPPTAEQAPSVSTTLVVLSLEEKGSEDKPTKDEPPSKKLKFLVPNLNIPSLTPLKFSPTPPSKIADKGKSIATEDDPTKQLMPFIEQNVKDVDGKRLALLKSEKEKSKKKLKKVMTLAEIQAQAQKLAYYTINNSTKEATMRITKNDQPLNLTVYDKFVLKMLGFNEWIEIHALDSKLGIPPPPELLVFGMSAYEKNGKRTSNIIKEVFVSKDIVVDGMHKNLVPPPGVEGSRGLVIKEPESMILFYNGNFDLVLASNEDSLCTKHQRAVKDSLDAKP
ncbi:hypothetical protein Tco_0771276 [Tanacetum coccineum]|uniref:Uncharacterized protein n=1 Tax=Tanacetum coccineum TaxID=301880 RepID=A0ABQ4ZFH4_9ASTR